ncbi:hypothetical protein TNCV_3074171 [Trichonephila clavipes]|uniref:Uncharacterized protein n=1 Tax=Trichonephila clavipes TaxID=2585209 RepID=A0A8X6SFF5_TRICX|nr:hypothetical protein TNCV_3074171 [Trichonephila clavipes]
MFLLYSNSRVVSEEFLTPDSTLHQRDRFSVHRVASGFEPATRRPLGFHEILEIDSSMDPLDPDNYSSWSTDGEVLLMERNCCVTGNEIKPEDDKIPKEQ